MALPSTELEALSRTSLYGLRASERLPGTDVAAGITEASWLVPGTYDPPAVGMVRSMIREAGPNETALVEFRLRAATIVRQDEEVGGVPRTSWKVGATYNWTRIG